jgi:hypothetical protein
MRGSTPRLAICGLFAFLCLGFSAGPTEASQCSDVYPDARQGPPPEWTFWADGSACYIRWKTNNSVEEEALIAQCRDTPGVRFIHFERDSGTGSICIFKLLNSEPATAEVPNQQSADQETKLEPDQDLQSTHYRKADAENPLLEELKLLVTTWTEKCLKEEKIEDYGNAGRCWRNGATAIDEFTVTEAGFITQEFADKVDHLKMAWLSRSDQLEIPIVKAVKKDAALIVPKSTSNDGPDPNRLAETAICSSTNLGDYKSCLKEPHSTGENTYAFGLRSSCKSGAIAAIKTHNADGKCIRKVVMVLPPAKRSKDVRSYGEPSVLDAISYKDADAFKCYARRHDQISCDGKVDYGALAPVEEKVAEVKIKGKSQRQALKKKRATESQEKEEEKVKEPSLLTRVGSGIKNLFTSD